jgi:hypothetical protein
MQEIAGRGADLLGRQAGWADHAWRKTRQIRLDVSQVRSDKQAGRQGK